MVKKAKTLNFRIPKRKVTVAGVDLGLRALTLADIASLAQEHAPEMRKVFSDVASQDGGSDMSEVIGRVLASSPDLVADAFSRSADVPLSEAKKILKLPLAEAVTIIAEIVNATLVGGVALEQMWGALATAAEGIAPALAPPPPSPSTNGS